MKLKASEKKVGKKAKISDETKKRSSKKNPITPIVGIIMGSDSDLKSMQAGAEVLEEFSVPFEIRIVSAHRTPDQMLSYAKEAENRGLKIIIAGAGGAAHLPGMVASATLLPVIGVPVNVTSLDGLDALLSVVQMPKGVPVATVAIDNSTNAGLLAVRILALQNAGLKVKLEKFKGQQERKVAKANHNLRNLKKTSKKNKTRSKP